MTWPSCRHLHLHLHWHAAVPAQRNHQHRPLPHRNRVCPGARASGSRPTHHVGGVHNPKPTMPSHAVYWNMPVYSHMSWHFNPPFRGLRASQTVATRKGSYWYPPPPARLPNSGSLLAQAAVCRHAIASNLPLCDKSHARSGGHSQTPPLAITITPSSLKQSLPYFPMGPWPWALLNGHGSPSRRRFSLAYLPTTRSVSSTDVTKRL